MHEFTCIKRTSCMGDLIDLLLLHFLLHRLGFPYRTFTQHSVSPNADGRKNLNGSPMAVKRPRASTTSFRTSSLNSLVLHVDASSEPGAQVLTKAIISSMADASR